MVSAHPILQLHPLNPLKLFGVIRHQRHIQTQCMGGNHHVQRPKSDHDFPDRHAVCHTGRRWTHRNQHTKRQQEIVRCFQIGL